MEDVAIQLPNVLSWKFFDVAQSTFTLSYDVQYMMILKTMGLKFAAKNWLNLQYNLYSAKCPLENSKYKKFYKAQTTQGPE